MTLYEAANTNRGQRSLAGFPLAGPIFVAASFDDGGTHSGYGKYCYDFMGAAADGRTLRASVGQANEDFAGFGAAVLAVEEGVVESLANDDPDGVPGRITFSHDGNYVAVRHADGSLGWYMHLKQGSVAVQVDQRVRRGEKLGELGNSGMSHAPHLHFCVLDAAGVSLPIQFPPRNARRLTGADRRSALRVYQTGWLLE
jgi:murein DD-endopeptidase MepM/ murein hydrolase activator NlpD